LIKAYIKANNQSTPAQETRKEHGKILDQTWSFQDMSGHHAQVDGEQLCYQVTV